MIKYEKVRSGGGGIMVGAGYMACFLLIVVVIVSMFQGVFLVILPLVVAGALVAVYVAYLGGKRIQKVVRRDSP